jgi:hypothetical protein
MLKTISLLGSAVLLAAVVGCAADVAPLDTGDHGPAPGAEQASSAPQSFAVQLRDATTAETVIPALVAAAHDQLAAACESTPGASVRVVNPLASGDFADVSCAAILGGTELAGESQQALTSGPSDGPLGEAQQSITPVAPIICGLAALIAATAGARACSDWRGPNSQFCNVGNFGTNVAWLFACGMMF